MARPLRIDVAGGWYHVMSRGIERRSIFLDDTYCLHFLDLLGEMSLRVDIEVHVARMRSRLTLREIGDAAGGMAYRTVSTSVRRFKARLAREPVMKRLAQRLLAELANVEM